MNKKDKNELRGKGIIPLGVCMIDWLNLTSFEPSVWAGFEKSLEEYFGDRWHNEGKESKIHVYEGTSCSLPGVGWAFLGSGMQGGKQNVMLRVTGRLADRIFNRPYVQSVLIGGIAKASRIDLQVTVVEPKNWSQWELMVEMKERGHNVAWIDSIDRVSGKNLATIYHGSRHSSRYTRLYEKLSKSGDVLLRFETEYKGDRAKQVAKSLCEEMKDKGWQYLSHEMNGFKSSNLNKAMKGVLLPDAAVTERVVRERGMDSTLEWIKGVCLPVIDRYLKQHDDAGREINDILISMLVNRAELFGGEEEND